ncbi:MAG: Nucleotidyltransferase domain protein [Candidatus Bathyarchaeota archaeon BA2]|nr:MAG: Nucleotidyltransferase domain protein [Candidatus Bathyarchaeota archaeon BA2]
MIDVEIDEVKAFLEGQKHVRVTYLFGSYAKGKVGPLSDVDIAVLLDGRLDKQESFDLRLRLINGISSILKTDKLDVVVMNNAPLLLNYNIISQGRVLDSKDELERAMFETRILSRYLDRRYYDERHVKMGVKRMAERGIL